MDYLSTGLVAFLGIALWDTVRMLLQTWWIKRSLENTGKHQFCPRCGSKMQGEGDGKDSCND
jgi:hypothetical protein